MAHRIDGTKGEKEIDKGCKKELDKFVRENGPCCHGATGGSASTPESKATQNTKITTK